MSKFEQVVAAVFVRRSSELRSFNRGSSIALLTIAATMGTFAVDGVAAEPTGISKPEVWAATQAIAATDGTPDADAAAKKAARMIQELPGSRISEVLAGFGSATSRGKNRLRAIVADVSDNGAFPQTELLAYFQNRRNDPDARYVAYQLLIQQDNAATESLLADATTDPSLPIRYLKIESMIKQAVAVTAEQPQQAIDGLRQVVSNGRSPAQLEKAAKLLADLDVKINLADELGMMRTWWLIGPFDNTNSNQFATAFVPENRYLETGNPIANDASGKSIDEQGKDKSVGWQLIQSEDNLGMVDLNGPLANEKDAAAYAFIRFTIAGGESIPKAEARIGCITANKVWVNGKPVSSNEVYHSGTRIDQYVGDCELIDGENTVLIKVMQNAQTEPWAQDWQFQFRLTRPDGSAITTVADTSASTR